MNEVYVVWKYDFFPYLIGGEASKTRIKNGKVSYYVNSYRGWVDNPVYVMDTIEGRQFLDDIRILKADLRNEQDLLVKKFKERLNDIKTDYGLEIDT